MKFFFILQLIPNDLYIPTATLLLGLTNKSTNHPLYLIIKYYINYNTLILIIFYKLFTFL